MLKTPTSQSATHLFALPFLFAICLPFFAKTQNDLGISVVTTQNGDQVTANFHVHNFEEIVSVQYTIQWDPAMMQFESVDNFGLPDISELSNFGWTPNNVDIGKLPHSWSSSTLSGITIPDCGIVFSVNFTSLNGQVSTITIGEDPTPFEVMNSDWELFSVVQLQGCNDLGRIGGKIFNDDNGNCQKDEDEAGIPGCQVKFAWGNEIFLLDANDEGEFTFPCLPGSYEVTAILPENINWEACQPTYDVLVEAGQEVAQNFGINPPDNPSSTDEAFVGNFYAKITPNAVRIGQPILLETTAETSTALTLQVFDSTGKMLGNWQRNAPAGTSNHVLEIPLAQGAYFIKVVGEDGAAKTLRFVAF